jgi:tetratricopeptide (TPR) repeat protein
LDSLGTLHTRIGQPAPGTEYHQQALAVFRATGEREGECWVHNGLGEAAHAAGRNAEALDLHTTAHAIAVDIGARDQQARAHAGLAHADHALGHPQGARRHYRHALALYRDLAMPEADRIEARLAAIGAGGGD